MFSKIDQRKNVAGCLHFVHGKYVRTKLYTAVQWSWNAHINIYDFVSGSVGQLVVESNLSRGG